MTTNIETAEGTIDKRALELSPVAAGALAAGLSFVGALAAGRILYEGLFPALLWLGEPLPGLLVAVGLASLGWLSWRLLARSLARRLSEQPLDAPRAAAWTALIPFLPLLLNLAYLFDPTVNLQRSRFLFLASLWLAVVLLTRLITRPKIWRWLAYVLIVGFLLPVYLATMGRTVGTADTFEFQVVVPQLGIVHPTGYPLYLLLAKPFTWLPLNEVAWRVNLATLVFGLAAVCLLYTLGRRLTGWSILALLAAVIFGLTPTFWNNAINAEVYSLHALIVAAALLLMREIGDWRIVAGGQWLENRNVYPLTTDHRPLTTNDRSLPWHAFYSTVLLALALGLGLANHLTTVVLLPAAGLAIFFAWRAGRFRGAPLSGVSSVVTIVGAFCLPLLLYAYLPIRWAAVNGEPMGLDRFADWVIGGRFQGALQLNAWLIDGVRYGIVGRLLLDEWPATWGLAVIAIGLVFLFFRQWRYALLLAITWMGYSFYALNYYVPDLAVFLIPAYLIMALFWTAGLVAIMVVIARLIPSAGAHFRAPVQAMIILIAVSQALLMAAEQTWPAVDSSHDDGRSKWGSSVLDLPIPAGAAILADSDKFPPLYYQQQAEGKRPDLEIVVLPDESAYRAELEARVAAGQPVYLARFLPGLEGIYHLRSLGPLTEVGITPVTAPPAGVEPLDISFGAVQLLAFQLAPSPVSEGESAITFFWQASEPLTDALHVYTRWASETFTGPAMSQHPAGDTFPTVAWHVGEVIPDFHALPQPFLAGPERVALQVALAPPFTPAEDLDWQTVTTVDGQVTEPAVMTGVLRTRLGPLNLDGAAIVESGRRETPLVVRLAGDANAPEPLSLAIAPAGSVPGNVDWQSVNPAIIADNSGQASEGHRLSWTGRLGADVPAGSYDILAAYDGQPASCGWLARQADSCVIGQVELSGVTVPAEASNFEDKIALLDVQLPEKTLSPGGELSLTLTWQALAPMSEDYTVFVQVLDVNDRIVGQVDAWPLQGTYPTGQWAAGETVKDPYVVHLSEELPPGQYKLNVGWYLLETLRRLPVVDQDGQAVDDRVIVSGLTMSE
ncbi:MAG: DUF2723 domain-containing protein [Chloroflexota bacterium]|nr:MAG: DUF2723 domain-containing protein [Chloroflexota bacterium]